MNFMMSVMFLIEKLEIIIQVILNITHKESAMMRN